MSCPTFTDGNRIPKFVIEQGKHCGKNHRRDVRQGRSRQNHHQCKHCHRLALKGHKTIVIDFDVGLRNLDLIMGCERRVVYDLINVIHGEATLNQAMIKDKHCDNLYVLPASQTRDKDALTEEGVGKVLEELAQDFEYIVCDSPAGIERGAVLALYYADEAIVVTNPEVSSVRDSDRILGILAAKSRRALEKQEPVKEHLLITRYAPSGSTRAKCCRSRTSRTSCASR